MNRFESAALDRHITGNYGEDFFREDFDEVEAPEELADDEVTPWMAGAIERDGRPEDELRAAARREGLSLSQYLDEWD